MVLANHDSSFFSEIQNHSTEMNTQILTLPRQPTGTEMVYLIEEERKDVSTIGFILKLFIYSLALLTVSECS